MRAGAAQCDTPRSLWTSSCLQLKSTMPHLKNGSASKQDCHQLNSMDNTAFEPVVPGEVGDPAATAPGHLGYATVELGELTASLNRSSSSSYPAQTALTVPLCRPDLCRALHSKQLPAKKADPQASSPWHRYKTFFLIGTLVGLVVWLILYLVLEHFNVL